ncbi:MAG: gamma-glutamyl-gamma-aminobutyrate hydrolase family protein [Xanthomonadales bacterium]|nr:gamma-glutamyl-gamma-aminobutyrate hydrolase family protein [Xanthomonadales bacterium]
MAERPRIGVTGTTARVSAARLATALAVYRAGGRPVQLGSSRQDPDESLSGIVITGGSDINPMHYGSTEAPWSPPDVLRDEFELAVLGFADRLGLPVLGICRGAQLVNVHAGGNLYSDIAHLRKLGSHKSTVLPRKWVEVDSTSALAGVLGTARLRVNSLHHQAVKDLGKGLRVVARDRDNITQAIEGGEQRWLVGVQWHPEYLQYQRHQQALFRALVAAARRYRR